MDSVMSQYPSTSIPSAGQGIAGNVPTRQTEASRELSEVGRDATQLKKLSEELIQRLASVISPRGEEIEKTPEQTEVSVSTPLATNIRQVHKDLSVTIKSLQFILRGVEL